MKRIAQSFMIVVTLAALPRSAAAQLTAEQQFAEGRRLIQANCGDCRGATKQNLEKGLASIRSAIAAGYPDKVEAYKALADGLTTLEFVYSTPDSPAQADVDRERQRVYGQLVELRPKDAQIAYLYATALKDQPAQLEALRRVIWLEPRHAGAHFAIGMILYRNSQRSEAITALRLALEFSDRADVEAYGNQLINILMELGRKTEIDDVRAIIKTKASR